MAMRLIDFLEATSHSTGTGDLTLFPLVQSRNLPAIREQEFWYLIEGYDFKEVGVGKVVSGVLKRLKEITSVKNGIVSHNKVDIPSGGVSVSSCISADAFKELRGPKGEQGEQGDKGGDGGDGG